MVMIWMLFYGTATALPFNDIESYESTKEAEKVKGIEDEVLVNGLRRHSFIARF